MRSILLFKKILWLLLVLINFSAFGQNKTFTNPILPSGADPFSTYHDGFYYYTHTVGDKIVLWKTSNLANIAQAEKRIIWMPPEGTMYSKDIWAPEFHFINGSWYVYFAADDGDNKNHRMYVLQNTSDDPFKGEWEFKGKVSAWPDRWAIDGNVFHYDGDLYMVWSGWEGNKNGQQNIYIAKMKNPLEIMGKRVLLSKPVYNWEKQGDLNDKINPPHVNVNEGPQFLEHQGEIFIVYSASGCWTDFYSLGLLKFEGEDILDPASWTKHPEPLFSTSKENDVYAPGHNSFFKSPDGTEDWILYHANSNPNEGCGGKRSPRMQRIEWNKNGMPFFGIPVSEDKVLKIPAE